MWTSISKEVEDRFPATVGGDGTTSSLTGRVTTPGGTALARTERQDQRHGRTRRGNVLPGRRRAQASRCPLARRAFADHLQAAGCRRADRVSGRRGALEDRRAGRRKEASMRARLAVVRSAVIAALLALVVAVPVSAAPTVTPMAPAEPRSNQCRERARAADLFRERCEPPLPLRQGCGSGAPHRRDDRGIPWP